MPTTYLEPFSFKQIFIDYFLGTEQLFMYAFVIIFAYVSAKYGFSNKVFLSLLALGGMIFALWLGSGWYFLVVIILGFIAFKLVGRFITG